ncbi:MAG: hypothetical protein AVDCRST_MAG75-3267, partial [uncultured Propionibacteriaceae bacterium]
GEVGGPTGAVSRRASHVRLAAAGPRGAGSRGHGCAWSLAAVDYHRPVLARHADCAARRCGSYGSLPRRSRM